MPVYNISVVIDPADATRGARVVEAKLVDVQKQARGVETAVQRAFDFNTGPAVSGVSAVDKALDGVTQSAKDAGQAASGAVRKAADEATKANNRIINSNAQVRASQISLGQQFNDFATQVLAGGSVVTAFAQQSGQAAFALQGFNGVLGTVGRFLAGPWGTLLIIGTTILANFITKMLEGKDSTEEAEKALQSYIQRQSEAARFIDQTTGKLIQQNRALAENARLLRIQSIEEQRKRQADFARQAFDQAQKIAEQTATGRTFVAERQPFAYQYDPQVGKAIGDARGDVAALQRNFAALRAKRPDLAPQIDQLALLTGQSLDAAAQVKQLTGEMEDLDTVLKGGTVSTSSMVEREVALTTATTELERAQARLSIVRSRGAQIDRMAGKEREAALVQYRRDLTEATQAVNTAEQAQTAARKATAAGNRELRAQAAAARAAARELDRMNDFLARLRDQGDALAKRGLDSQIEAQVDAFTRQFNKAPTPDQRQAIEDAVKRNQLLSDEKAILDQLLGPLEQYQRSIAALNDLLLKGKITQEEYNRALSELPLQQSLDAVDKSLSGTLFAYDAQLKAIEDSIARAVKVVDDAEKAGILKPEEAERRRVALRGQPGAEGEITVNGGPPGNLRDQQIDQLNRQRREPLRQLDLGLESRPDLQKKAKIEGVDNEEQDRLRTLMEAREQEIISEQEFQDRKTAIIEEANAKRRDIELAESEMRVQSAASVADSLLNITENLAGKQSAAYKAMFVVTKAFAIAEAVINIQRALASATASLPFPANLPVIATVAAEGASIIAAITSVAGSFQKGGYTGDGGESEPAGIVHGKEFVMNARATRENRALLEALNSGRTYREARAVSSSNDNGNGRPLNVRVDTSDYPGATGDVRYVTSDEVEIRIKKGVAEQTPKVVAGQLNNPNSRVSKGIYRTTTAKRKRG